MSVLESPRRVVTEKSREPMGRAFNQTLPFGEVEDAGVDFGGFGTDGRVESS